MGCQSAWTPVGRAWPPGARTCGSTAPGLRRGPPFGAWRRQGQEQRPRVPVRPRRAVSRSRRGCGFRRRPRPGPSNTGRKNSSTYARLTPVIPCQFVIPLQSYLPCFTCGARLRCHSKGGCTVFRGVRWTGPPARRVTPAPASAAELCEGPAVRATVLFDISDEIIWTPYRPKILSCRRAGRPPNRGSRLSHLRY